MEVTATPLLASPDRPYFSYTGSGVTKSAWYSNFASALKRALGQMGYGGTFFQVPVPVARTLTAIRPLALPGLWPKTMSSDEGRMQGGHIAYIMHPPYPSEPVCSTTPVFLEIINMFAIVP